jgi:shikimate 5-dehydrogenase
MKYHLIGKNIETSLSPRIHNFLFKLKDRKPTYQ